ncbi:MAG: HlyD family efflux transporter periplasmic adaptor subunit [Pseudomonadota bacterium]
MLSIPFQGVDIRFPITLARQGTGKFLTFEGLSGRQRETLAVFYRSILSGKMASTEEVITSLDTPVDLVPMEETEEEKTVATAGKSPRSLRAAFSILLYLCLGAGVLWTLGAGIWGKLSTVDIENARIEAMLLPHAAADRSFVKDVLVAPGDPVAQGDVLVRLTDPEGEAALRDVRSRIELIELRLADAADAEARLASRLADLRARIVAALQPTFPTVAALLEAFDGRYAPDYRDLFDAHEAALAQVDTLSDELRRLKRERGQLRDAGDGLHVVAQRDGIVTDITAIKGQLVGRGALVAVIEAGDARQARGWLDPSMASAVFPGMAVTVEVATAEGPRTLKGEVSAIAAGIDPGMSPDFGMLVSVSFPDLTSAETRDSLPHLAPVQLAAERPWARDQAERWDAFQEWAGF